MDTNRVNKAKSPIRVVIADDHPAIRVGMRALLNRSKDIVVVGEASNGDEAVDIVKKYRPDVLVLDLEMPGTSGLEAARMINLEKLPVSILVVSAYADRELVHSTLQRGVRGYLTKDEAPDLIVQAIRAVVKQESGWFSERVNRMISV